jgi:hypothetical protein
VINRNLPSSGIRGEHHCCCRFADSAMPMGTYDEELCHRAQIRLEKTRHAEPRQMAVNFDEVRLPV